MIEKNYWQYQNSRARACESSTDPEIKGYYPGYKAMVKHMLMMGKELHKKMEMCAMNAYVM